MTELVVTEVSAPDGSKIKVQHPPGASEQEIIAYAQENYSPEVPQDVQDVASFVRSQSGMPKGNSLGNSYSPANQLSGGQQLAAGAGKFVSDTGLAVQQMLGLKNEEDVAAVRERDSSLMNTGMGKAGYIGGGVVSAAPLSLVPGANTYTGAALAGAGYGALTPTGEGESRSFNTALGAGLGVAGKGAMDLLTTPGGNHIPPQRQQAISDTIEDGYLMRPSAGQNPTRMQALAESLSGKDKTNWTLSKANQQTTNSLAKRAVGLPDDQYLNHDSLAELRRQAYQSGYEPIKKMGRVSVDDEYLKALSKIQQGEGAMADFPGIVDEAVIAQVDEIAKGFDASSAIPKIQQLRELAGKAFANQEGRQGYAYKQMAEEMEKLIQRRAPDDLLGPFRDARRTIARTHALEGATNPETGDVSARLLAEFGRKNPGTLTDDLESIARAYRVDPGVTKSPDYSPSLSIMDIMATAYGVGSGNYAAAAVAPLRTLARPFIMGRGVQQRIANPNVSANPMSRALAESNPAQSFIRNAGIASALQGDN